MTAPDATIAYDYALALIAHHDDCIISAAVKGPTLHVAAVALTSLSGRHITTADLATIPPSPARARLLERLALSSCEATCHQ